MGTGSAPVGFQERVYPASPPNAHHDVLNRSATSDKKCAAARHGLQTVPRSSVI
jgi:hypothetical protein